MGVLAGDDDCGEAGAEESSCVDWAGDTCEGSAAWMGPVESSKEAWDSSECGAGKRVACCKDWFAKSAAVSVAALKKAGEFFHPIGRTRGRATNGSCPGLEGKTRPSLGISLALTLIL